MHAAATQTSIATRAQQGLEQPGHANAVRRLPYKAGMCCPCSLSRTIMMRGCMKLRCSPDRSVVRMEQAVRAVLSLRSLQAKKRESIRSMIAVLQARSERRRTGSSATDRCQDVARAAAPSAPMPLLPTLHKEHDESAYRYPLPPPRYPLPRR